ncbi:MAG: hypothetical protein QGG84_09845, partial [Rhodospirillales bacterium]|nr:hypothetical protein [Rhodospirillales bacterium]
LQNKLNAYDHDLQGVILETRGAVERLALVEASFQQASAKHFTDIQIIELLAVIACGGFLNRWNDTIGTVTDQESIDFANNVLRPVGWDPGKHVGEPEEQRKAHPVTLGWTKK